MSDNERMWPLGPGSETRSGAHGLERDSIWSGTEAVEHPDAGRRLSIWGHDGERASGIDNGRRPQREALRLWDGATDSEVESRCEWAHPFRESQHPAGEQKQPASNTPLGRHGVGSPRTRREMPPRRDRPAPAGRRTPPSPPPPPTHRLPIPQGRAVRRRTQRRKVQGIMLSALLLLVVVFVGDLAIALIGLHGSLDSVVRDLDTARAAIASGDLQSATAYVASSKKDSDRAVRMANQPSLWLLAHIPRIGADAQTARDLALAASQIRRAGQDAVDALTVPGVKGDLTSGFYRNGSVNFEAVDSAAPKVADAEDMLTRADATLASAPQPALGFMSSALDRARAQVGSALDTARHANALMGALPPMLGADGSKRYLLAFQAPGEARATGGLIGIYGVLHAEGGKLRLGRIAPIRKAVPIEGLPSPVSAPKWFADSYAPQSALTQSQQANVSPDFPAVAKVLLNMFTAGTGQHLDGVIAMDPITLSYMMQGMDPIHTSLGTVTSDNVARVLLRDSYVRFPDPNKQNVFLTKLVKAFWSRVESNRIQGPDLIRGLATAVSQGHFMAYSDDPTTGQDLMSLGATGPFPLRQPSTQMIFNNNYGANKVDYFLHRSESTVVNIQRDGSADVTTTVTMHNESPASPPSLLIGPRKNVVPPGTNQMILNFLLPEGAQNASLSVNDGKPSDFQYRDRANPVVWNLLKMQPGQEVKATARYSIPDAITSSDRGAGFNFDVVPQPTINPVQFSLTVTVPDGFTIQSADGASTGTRSFSEAGPLLAPRSFALVINQG